MHKGMCKRMCGYEIKAMHIKGMRKLCVRGCVG